MVSRSAVKPTTEKKAIERVIQRKPEIVVLDINMPVMSE
jgi:CheY-like chemotaxis protein